VCPGTEVVVGDERVPRVLEIRRALGEDVLHGVDLGAVGATGFAGAVQPGGAVAYEPDPAPLVVDVEGAQELDLGLREVRGRMGLAADVGQEFDVRWVLLVALDDVLLGRDRQGVRMSTRRRSSRRTGRPRGRS
jgi:hypothetical protein